MSSAKKMLYNSYSTCDPNTNRTDLMKVAYQSRYAIKSRPESFTKDGLAAMKYPEVAAHTETRARHCLTPLTISFLQG